EASRAVAEQVGDEAHRWLGRKDVRATRGVLLEDVVLHRAGDLVRRAPLLLRHELVEEQKHRGGGIDGHRGRDPIERYVLEQGLHVLERVDRFQGQAAVVLNFLHVSTNSVSTPPTLLGCTNAMRVPCKPIRGSSSIISRPRARASAIAFSMSGTATAMWCRPGPRLARNFPTGVSSRRGWSSSTSASPARKKAAVNPSF